MLPKNKVETLRMLGFLKWLGIIIVVLALGISVFLFGMRFHDGPLEIVSGGPFKTGELAEAPDDWSFLTDRMEIESVQSQIGYKTSCSDSNRIKIELFRLKSE